jgi:outer membrane protein OmpA-like peptidoglycan-associated protein
MSKQALLITVVLGAAGIASAEPRQSSQHPRMGELGEIAFSERSTQLSVDYDTKLGELAGWARENPSGLLVIDGHASASEARHEDGAELALRRAEAVRDELLALAVAPEQIVVAGFGQSSHAGSPGRDRRVVVWGTHEPLATVLVRLDEAGAKKVEQGVTPGLRPEVPRPTLVER